MTIIGVCLCYSTSPLLERNFSPPLADCLVPGAAKLHLCCFPPAPACRQTGAPDPLLANNPARKLAAFSCSTPGVRSPKVGMGVSNLQKGQTRAQHIHAHSVSCNGGWLPAGGNARPARSIGQPGRHLPGQIQLRAADPHCPQDWGAGQLSHQVPSRAHMGGQHPTEANLH